MRILPPLLVLGVLALVVVRCAQQPARPEVRARIAGLIQASDADGAARLLEIYAQRYRDAEDHWFRCASWFRLREPARAIEAVWGDPSLAAKPDTARRFGEIGLLALGWGDEGRRDATPFEPMALLTLCEGGHPWALARLSEHARSLDLKGFSTYYIPSVRQTTSAPMRVLVDAARTREGEQYAVAAAMGALGTLPDADYPERAADVATLKDVIDSTSWRRDRPEIYAASATALGRSRDPDGVTRLDRMADRLRRSKSARDRSDLPVVLAGLLAAGRFDVQPELERLLVAENGPSMALAWYVEALLHAQRRGEGEAQRLLLEFWNSPAVKLQEFRARIARGLLLHDEPPSPESGGELVQQVVRTLEGDPESSLTRVLAAAWRLRMGETGSRAGLLDLLRKAGAAAVTGAPGALEVSTPFLEALRALYLYG